MADSCTVATEDVRAVCGLVSLLSRSAGTYMTGIPGFGPALEAIGRLEAAADQAGMPDDPVTPIAQVAIYQHAVLEAYIEAGFERSEAFSLVHAHVAGAAIRHGTGD